MTILKQVRLRDGKSQKEMAKELGINFFTYRSYEQGVRELPIEILKKILVLRGTKEDLKLVKVLEEVYG